MAPARSRPRYRNSCVLNPRVFTERNLELFLLISPPLLSTRIRSALL
jgi:hypothetical protein